jgi:hypothetical protein
MRIYPANDEPNIEEFDKDSLDDECQDKWRSSGAGGRHPDHRMLSDLRAPEPCQGERELWPSLSRLTKTALLYGGLRDQHTYTHSWPAPHGFHCS